MQRLSAAGDGQRYAQATTIGFDRAINTMLRFVERLFQRNRFPTPTNTTIASHLKSGR
jgi:hypothetical protein